MSFESGFKSLQKRAEGVNISIGFKILKFRLSNLKQKYVVSPYLFGLSYVC